MLKCPNCGSGMVLKDGEYGLFYGCSTYPKCRGSRPYEEGNGEQITLSPASGNKCIRCGEYDTLSAMGLCSYCQNVWDQD